jgi:hypothetical protein
MVFLNFF